jgi:type II secretory pathway pseudopilin PulG
MKSSAPTKGFVLPIAIGVGLIAILLGVMVIARSSQNRVTATAQKETARSLAAAETGIAQFQSLFNRYRPLATYCSSHSAPAPSSCGTVTWQNVKNSDLAGSDVCETAATFVKDYANSQWKSVSSDPNDGQFRLVSYFYKPDATGGAPVLPGTGELILEGRVNRNVDNTASNRTSTTRIKIRFPVTNLPPNRADVPGLWVSSGADSSVAASTVQPEIKRLETNIRDSACTAAINKTLQAQQPSSYEYQSTPRNYFPLLPAEGSSPPETDVTGFYDIPSPITGPEKLPRIDDVDRNNVYTYRIAANNNLSIDLTDDKVFWVGESSKTVVLYLDGGINVDKSQIIAASGSRLIIYAHGPVALSGKSTLNPIDQEDSPAAQKVQLYVYPSISDPAPPVNMSGGSASEPMQLLLFAPNSQVIFNGASQIEGSIWAKSWQGSADSVLEQASTDLSKVKITFPRISPITVWQRLAIP